MMYPLEECEEQRESIHAIMQAYDFDAKKITREDKLRLADLFDAMSDVLEREARIARDTAGAFRIAAAGEQ